MHYHAPVVTPDIESGVSSIRGGGWPLPKSTRAFFERRFGHDFSRVRVHTGEPAVEAAKSVKAKASTMGKDVVFGTGQYSPDTGSGKHLLAHELTHVVQQSCGKISPRLQRDPWDPWDDWKIDISGYVGFPPSTPQGHITRTPEGTYAEGVPTLLTQIGVSRKPGGKYTVTMGADTHIVDVEEIIKKVQSIGKGTSTSPPSKGQPSQEEQRYPTCKELQLGNVCTYRNFDSYNLMQALNPKLKPMLREPYNKLVENCRAPYPCRAPKRPEKSKKRKR
jgi:hypothetical protein